MLSKKDKELLVSIAQHKCDGFGDDVEVDPVEDDKSFSEGEEGTWVHAWVWVSDGELTHVKEQEGL
jgi:hypothetical protein